MTGCAGCVPAQNRLTRPTPLSPEVPLLQFHQPGIFNYSALLLSEDQSTLYVGAREAVFAVSALDVSRKQHEVRPAPCSLLPAVGREVPVYSSRAAAPVGLGDVLCLKGGPSPVPKAPPRGCPGSLPPRPPSSAWISKLLVWTISRVHRRGWGSGQGGPLSSPVSPPSAPSTWLGSKTQTHRLHLLSVPWA